MPFLPVPELRESPSQLQVDQQWREMMESASKQPNCIIIAADKDRLTGTLLTECNESACRKCPEQHVATDSCSRHAAPVRLPSQKPLLHSACRKRQCLRC